MTRILIVEDDDEIAMTVELVLIQESYEIRRAKNGLLGLDALHGLGGESPPDLVLLDLVMPEVTGWEFLRAKNADRTVQNIPVIVVTARTSNEARMGDLDGVLLIIHKPFELEELLTAVDRATHPVSTVPPPP
jgi:DNA-binding response OmpR family regulator